MTTTKATDDQSRGRYGLDYSEHAKTAETLTRLSQMQMITFPKFSGVRCLMMPYVQGDSSSVPSTYSGYNDIIDSVFVRKGDIGFLTIDESPVTAGKAHRGARAKFARALHTEAGRDPQAIYCWGGSGGGNWGGRKRVELERGVKILVASNVDDSCAVWNAEQEETSLDGDIGHLADAYPYSAATFLKAGEVCEIGILTPHESLPLAAGGNRQFLRIVGAGVHGREEYFTENPLVGFRD